MLILLVPVIEIGEISNQISDHKHVGQRDDIGGSGSVCINGLQACNCVGAINVHRT